MTTLVIETRIAAPIELCFDLARDVDTHVLTSSSTGERAVGGKTSGLKAARSIFLPPKKPIDNGPPIRRIKRVEIDSQFQLSPSLSGAQPDLPEKPSWCPPLWKRSLRPSRLRRNTNGSCLCSSSRRITAAESNCANNRSVSRSAGLRRARFPWNLGRLPGFATPLD